MRSGKGYSAFTVEEAAAMVEAAPCLWWRAFIELLSTSGLRTQEVLRLHASDVDERTLSIRITSDPPDEYGNTERVTLRAWLPPHRERVVPVTPEVMRTLVRFRSERTEDSHVFIPDCRLDQLWPRIVSDEPLASELLSPGLSAWFGMIQRRARLVLARTAAVPLSEIRWPHRSLRALRDTAIWSLSERLSPPELEERVGYVSTKPVLRYYDSTSALVRGAA